jgi:hypothetical protein
LQEFSREKERIAEARQIHPSAAEQMIHKAMKWSEKSCGRRMLLEWFQDFLAEKAAGFPNK